ncbi:Protein DOG1-like 4 [Vitis vinifera]|uniref:Protein DOG1-like 4 n=1 Tax=Vitis vinifera TaxID=29760 RepID=A0A438E3I2_VITVI|nr:Protein DOG1-like 4 [Vitis vinifera]
MPLANNNPNPNPGPFERFFRGWLVRQEELRQLLLQATERDCDEEAGLQELIGRAVAHYAEYYKAKQRVVREDVLILLGPPWLTPFERSLLWIGGFKPGFAFRLVTNYVTNLTEEQKQRMEQLRAETAEDERKLTAELSRVRTRPTAISLVEMATMARERVNGERETVDERIEMMKLAVEILVECADYLRCKTALKIMGILNPSQNVKFLLAVTQLQRRVRNWRMEREAESSTDNSRH